MNQILVTNNDKSKKSNSNDTKKIIIFFGVVILVFGLAIAGVYGYKMINKDEDLTISKPQLKLEETEREVTIIAKSEIGIDKIIYTWDEEELKEVEMNGRTSHEEKIDIPNGESILKVKVVDKSGQEIDSTKSFNRKFDDTKPIIETSIVNSRLKITATDETAIKYITYKWNEEEAITVEAETPEDVIIETTIDIKRGKNTLIITAVDSSDNLETIDKLFSGVNNPVIEVVKIEDKLNMKITHDMGFEKVEFSINGKIYTYDKNFSGYDSTKQEIEYQFSLKEGENIVIITAVSTEGTQEIYKGKCNYTAE
ncbi:MAG: hypothetical protein Q4G09_07270 [Clostridia bacterium]|nr:hypothetical protein [Clostridia bacterium]